MYNQEIKPIPTGQLTERQSRLVRRGLAPLLLTAGVVYLATLGDSPKPTGLTNPRSPLSQRQVDLLPTKPEVANVGDGASNLIVDANGSLANNTNLENQVVNRIEGQAPNNGEIQAGSTYQVPILPEQDRENPQTK